MRPYLCPEEGLVVVLAPCSASATTRRGEPKEKAMPYKDHFKEVPRLCEDYNIPFEAVYKLFVKSDDVAGLSKGHLAKALELLHEEGFALTHSPPPASARSGV